MAERHARAVCAEVGGTFSAVSRSGWIDHAGGRRCRTPAPRTFASVCSPPTRLVRAARPRSRGASGSASGRSRAGSGRPAPRADVGRRRLLAGGCRSGVRARCWPGWSPSGTTPPWPSTPTCSVSAPASGAAPRPCAAPSGRSAWSGRKDAPGRRAGPGGCRPGARGMARRAGRDRPEPVRLPRRDRHRHPPDQGPRPRRARAAGRRQGPVGIDSGAVDGSA
jgi:hypothetical protein